MAREERKPVSIRDVARASGVSLTTVSLILNQGDKRISQPTRERVLAAIDRLGYRPNRLAQGLQNRRSNILAILVPQLSHTFADVYFGELISGIYDQASDAGYKILLEAASPAFVLQKKYLDLFDRCFVDGMLFMGSNETHIFIRDLVRRKAPLIIVNNIMPDVDYVVCDYAMAGRLAAEHLHRLGHRRIGLIHGGSEIATGAILRKAFTDRLGEFGVELPPTHVEDGFYSEEGGAAAADRLLERNGDLTAIFAGNDKMAMGVTQRLLQQGRRVPQDVSVLGCDDIHQAAFVTPRLSTIRMPLYEVGRQCCRAMIEMLRSKAEPVRDVVPVEIVHRESTGPAR